ncbi:large ribosomal subunit protein eL39-like [Tenrec ecaudatus]|uniref:large ribosomal subunit protein eL39-like n=1 Tax=Tenrec ecaudatus TaxID=94439 RepID=UPI003F5AD649
MPNTGEDSTYATEKKRWWFSNFPIRSHKTFRIKRFLAKKQKQIRPIPQRIHMKTSNKIRSNSKRTHWRRINLG